MDHAPRLLIVYPYASIDTNPTMALLLESLAARGVWADVLCGGGDAFLPPKPFAETVRLESVPSAFFRRLVGDRNFAPGAVLTKFPMRVLMKLLRPGRHTDYRVGLDPLVFGCRKAGRYAAVVGVDPLGVAWASLLNRRSRKPLVYVSFEIIFAAEGAEGDLEALERAACSQASLVLIQDEERAEAFGRETSFPRDKMVLVPVAPPPQEVAKSNRLRTVLGIPPDRRVVLYTGNLDAWSSRDQLAEMVSYWPDNYCLVVHSFAGLRQGMARYLEGLKATGKICISSQPVERQELPDLIASADFGLAPYLPVPGNWMTGDNLYHLGLASGKVSYYALCGLPILARTLPVFDREFAAYRCGKVYRRLSETGQLLQEMDQNYAHYSGEARRFYRERLNPVPGMEQFCNRLLGLAGVRG